MNQVKYNAATAWNLVQLMIRIWRGYRMITASLSSVTGIIGSPKERIFFEKWFGEELHFPKPLLMAFLAKSSELIGGFLVIPGLLTRVSAGLIAFTMLVATLTANLGKDFNIDGGFTISYFMFALILLVQGGGKFSIDYLLSLRGLHKTSNSLN